MQPETEKLLHSRRQKLVQIIGQFQQADVASALRALHPVLTKMADAVSEGERISKELIESFGGREQYMREMDTASVEHRWDLLNRGPFMMIPVMEQLSERLSRVSNEWRDRVLSLQVQLASHAQQKDCGHAHDSEGRTEIEQVMTRLAQIADEGISRIRDDVSVTILTFLPDDGSMGVSHVRRGVDNETIADVIVDLGERLRRGELNPDWSVREAH